MDDVSYACDRCGFPAILVNGKFIHGSVADAAFCGFVFEYGQRGDDDE